MASIEVKERPGPRRLTESGGKLIVLAVAASCAGVLLAMPRPVAPRELPSLVLAPGPTGEVLAADHAAAAAAPKGPAVERLMALYGEQGRAETTPASGELQQRLAQIAQALEEVRRAHGREAIAALRAAALGRLEAALGGALPEGERVGLLGSFPRMLERYGLRRNGETVAPDFVVRTLYKARWNSIVGLPLTEGFAPVELQAYWGWLALHAEGAPTERRLAALDEYAEAGGARVAEARGLVAYRQGRHEEAAVWLGKAYRQERTWRLRNYLLALGVEPSHARQSTRKGQP